MSKKSSTFAADFVNFGFRNQTYFRDIEIMSLFNSPSKTGIMTSDLDILANYLKIRKSNAEKEVADMELMSTLLDKLRESRAEGEQQRNVISSLQRTIADMKGSRPITQIDQFNGNYIETAKIESLCQPSSPTSTERTSSMLNSSFNTTEQPSQIPPESKDK